MKTNFLFKAVGCAVLVALLPCFRTGATENPTDAFDLVRSIYQSDRQAVVARSLGLTESESAAFWPLYRSYRADMDKIGDDLVNLVLEYADQYPNVSENSARRLLKRYTSLEKKLVAKRSWYLKRAGRFLPPTKVLRWAQLENRMDLALRLQLAGSVPLAPAQKGNPASAR
jgi:hypothetical protein